MVAGVCRLLKRADVRRAPQRRATAGRAVADRAVMRRAAVRVPAGIGTAVLSGAQAKHALLVVWLTASDSLGQVVVMPHCCLGLLATALRLLKAAPGALACVLHMEFCHQSSQSSCTGALTQVYPVAQLQKEKKRLHISALS